MAKQQINSAQIKPAVTYTSVSYASGWGDYDSSLWYGVRYFKDQLGVVHMKGLLKNTSGGSKAAGSIAFNMPAGFRPVGNVRFSAPCANTASPASSGYVTLQPNGDMSVDITVPNSEWVSFGSVHYLAEQ